MPSLDDAFRAAVVAGEPEAPEPAAELVEVFEAQALSRHLDFAARWLQASGEGFYTIGSAGPRGQRRRRRCALRPTDPALLHYRSGGFYGAAGARQVPGVTTRCATCCWLVAAADDPISGGRHKVFGHPALHIIPQTSTIASHLPRAFGLAFALGPWPRLGVRARCGPTTPSWCASFGDASVNHSTAPGAFNATAYRPPRARRARCCWSARTTAGASACRRPRAGWRRPCAPRPASTTLRRRRRPGRGAAPPRSAPSMTCAGRRRPVVLHLRTVRLFGHAGSDAELAYRTPREIDRRPRTRPAARHRTRARGAGVLTAERGAPPLRAARDRVDDDGERCSPARRLRRPPR